MVKRVALTNAYVPTLACVLNGHDLCVPTEECKFDKEMWQFAHCVHCGMVRMFELDTEGKERWEPIDG